LGKRAKRSRGKSADRGYFVRVPKGESEGRRMYRARGEGKGIDYIQASDHFQGYGITKRGRDERHGGGRGRLVNIGRQSLPANYCPRESLQRAILKGREGRLPGRKETGWVRVPRKRPK